MNKIETFMDFCAGIGGGRLGLEKLGFKCLGFSEIDSEAEKTYREFFGNDEKNWGDLMKINPSELPDFDLLIAGFPCQTFSVIGQRKGLGDERGLIIYGLINILVEKNIKYFLLENVKGLLNHDNGRTHKIIMQKLDDSGYKVFPKVLNSLNFGVPQMRERIYLLGVRKDLVKANKQFEFPKAKIPPSISEYLIDTGELDFDEKFTSYKTFLKFLNNKYNRGQYKVDDLLSEEYLVIDTRQSDLRVYRDKTPTLRKGRHGILYVRNRKFRKLSGYESLLLQGFPEDLARRAKEKILNINLLSQAGNAMTVSTIKELGNKLIEYIN